MRGRAGRLLAGLLLAAAATACATNGGTVDATGHGDDRIRETARAIFAATGLTDRMLEGSYHPDDNQTGCAQAQGIPVADAWTARRSYSVEARNGMVVDRAAAYEKAVQHLRSSGWTVREYEGPFGGAPAFRADAKDAIVLYFGADSTFTVVVGPCSTSLPSLAEPAWHLVGHGRFTTPHPPKPPIRTPTPGSSAG